MQMAYMRMSLMVNSIPLGTRIVRVKQVEYDWEHKDKNGHPEAVGLFTLYCINQDHSYAMRSE